MHEINKKVHIDKDELIRIKAIERDLKTRFIAFQFLSNNIPIDLTGCNVRVYATTNEAYNNKIFNDLEVTDSIKGKARLELTEKMLIRGITKYQLMIFKGEGHLSSNIFELEVSKSLMDAEALESSNEFKSFENALEKIDKYDTRLRTVEVNIKDVDCKTENNKEYIKILNNKLANKIDFDISTLSPAFYTELNPKANSVLQCLIVTKDYIFTTQVYESLEGKSESYVISRLDKRGNLIDFMNMKYGGHGTSIGIEVTEEKIYVWSNYDVTTSTGEKIRNTIIKCEYIPEKTLEWGDPIIEEYNAFNNYAIPTIDQDNDKIAFRIHEGNRQKISLYRLSEFKAKSYNEIYSFIIPEDLTYMQGMCIDNLDFYWRTGDTNSVKYPDEITMFDMTNGNIKKRITCTFGNGELGDFEDDFREPEGIFMYKNKLSNKKTLFAPVVTGSGGKRNIKVYMYSELGSKEEFESSIKEITQQHILVKKGGLCKDLPTGVNKLTNITSAGTYYMTTAESSNFTDHPYPGIAGWILEVGALSGGVIQQTLKKNSFSDFIILTRLARNDSASAWKKLL